MMSCEGSLSSYERKKKELFNVNIWKSNFISLWEEYGTFKDVEGVRCFDYYDIDGAGEGQEKMSRHLKQPTLWQDVEDDDLDWVHFIFKFSKVVEINQSTLALWLDAYKTELEGYVFDRLEYVISADRVVSSYFLQGGVVVDDPFLNHLAFLLAERRNVDVSDASYGAAQTVESVKLLMDDLASYSFDDEGTYMIFDLPMIEDEIRSFLLAEGVGTDILDDLVVDGVLVGIGNVGTGTMEYAVPVDAAKKMNGFAFVKLIELALEFDYEVESHWYDFFVEIIGFVLAAVAAYFGFYQVALSLIVSTIAGKVANPYLQVLSAVVSFYAGGATSLATIGTGEAVSLLMNVYGLYMELSYKPEKTTEEETADDQNMFYRAPYDAYNNLYCYKDLTSVTVSAIP